VYNYIHHNMSFFIYVSALLHWLNIKSDDWQKNESVIIKNMFKWIFELNLIISQLMTIMKNKFNMYFWHLQKVEERKNYKWLHNMFYDLIQQIIHQLSIYYFTYVTLHNDHNWQLIFYSYYVKYQDSFNKIFFHHIDLNISHLIKNNKIACLIQESISLNTKQHNDCIKMLLRMHHYLENWWKNMQTRLQTKNKTALNDLIYRITHNK